LSIERVIPGQGAGNNERIAAPGFQRVGQRLFRVGIVIGAGNEELVAFCPRALLEQLGQPGITRVLQVRQYEAQGPAGPAPQGCGLGVHLKVMLTSHRKHFLDGVRLDAPGSPLAVDDIAGGGS
tara:strand:- start:3986 stop:4357 length:372 start_codon:yes stop_codon:yes gene_type:complete